MRGLLQDLTYAWRQLRKSPAFALVAVLTLGLGIGANTAIFSVMNAVLLRSLPVPNPQQLVYLNTTGWPSAASQTGEEALSFPEHVFEELRQQNQVFSDLMAFVPLSIGGISVRYGDEPEEATGDMVSGNFFSGLGPQPARGRFFTLSDEKHHTQVAVLSYKYWTSRFARNPSIIGQTIYIKSVPFTVIGVAPKDFEGVDSDDVGDLWIPLQDRPELPAWGQSTHDGESLYDSPFWWCLMMIGRLRDGVSPAQAVGQLNPVFQRAAYFGVGHRDPKEHPPNLYLTAARGAGAQRQQYQQPILVLMTMVGLVLLIACINVAMLLVARNTARQREFCIRMALGAGRGRLFGQLLTESLLLVAAGAAAGWLFAGWATVALGAWSQLPISLAPDRTVLAFTVAVSTLAALGFGLAPLRSAVRVAPGMALKTAAASASQDRTKFRSGQVVVALQMTFCVVLLVAAGLLLRTLRNLQTASLGMRTAGLLVFGITPPQSLHTDAQVIQFFHTLTDRLRSLPGVESATLMSNRIGSGWSNNTEAIVDGREPVPGKFSPMRWNAVGPDFFHVLGASLVLGRDFTDADTAASPKVAIVNQTFVKRYLASTDPIGHQVAISHDPKAPQFTIVAAVADSKYTSVEESPRPMTYLPFTQLTGVGTMHFELRTEGSPTALLPEVRKAARDLAPDLALLEPMTQHEQFERSYSQQQLYARLSSFFGILAALLVATGLYGTLAYRVSRRTAEIGVRMALGARRGQVLWMVLRESFVVSAAGLASGLPLAIVGARLLRSMLYGLSPGDPLVYAAALAGAAIVTLGASLIPARRAASVDPMQALRME
jgi:predicted permease